MFNKGIISYTCCLIFILFYSGCQQEKAGFNKDCKYLDSYTIDCGRDLIGDYPAKNIDGSINMVVEIPAGTGAKWEVNGRLEDGTKPDDGKLRWEFRNKKPRVVQYLPYPGNYGLIPNTKGGDGDPLDVLLLNPAVSRGSILKVRFIGVFKMLDGGEKDDKILAVMEGSPFYQVKNLIDLDQRFPGVKEIIKTWFTNYKGSGEITFQGWGGRDEAEEILNSSIQPFKK
jgi:inorganic pyrophosphatase